MTIDERLDKLTDRHEALTQTVELLTADVRDLTKKVDGLADSVHELTKDTVRMRSVMDDLVTGYGATAELIRRHENRLDRTEGR